MMFIWNFERMKKMQDVRNLTYNRCIIITNITSCRHCCLNASLMYCIYMTMTMMIDPELTHRGEQDGDGQADLGLGAR